MGGLLVPVRDRQVSASSRNYSVLRKHVGHRGCRHLPCDRHGPVGTGHYRGLLRPAHDGHAHSDRRTGILSPLLANIALSVLDEHIAQAPGGPESTSDDRRRRRRREDWATAGWSGMRMTSSRLSSGAVSTPRNYAMRS